MTFLLNTSARHICILKIGVRYLVLLGNPQIFKDAAVPVFELIFETSTNSKLNKQINEALLEAGRICANKVSP